MANFLCNAFKTDDLSIEGCIHKLVKISLERKASSIAVRFDPKKGKIQVVDNSIGFHKQELSRIFRQEEKDREYNKIFAKIRSLSNFVIITSRYKFSLHTYVKIASTGDVYKLFEGYQRPSRGTTVTAYKFNSCKWNDNENENNTSISYIIAALALAQPKVSFSLRNDDKQKILLSVNKYHSPWEVLSYIRDSQIHQEITNKQINRSVQKNKVSYDESGKKELNQNSSIFNFLNDSLNEYSCRDTDNFRNYINDKSNTVESNTNFFIASLLDKSLNEISDNDSGVHEDNDKSQSTKKNFVINLLNKSLDEFLNEKSFTNNNTFLSPLSEWSNWSYKPQGVGINKITRDYNNKFSLNQIDIVNDNFINLSQLSVWSDWSYQPVNLNNRREKKSQLKFCPDSFYKIFPYKSHKKEYTNECRMTMNTINSLQILKQINKEFIVGITNENGKKLLIIIDQHAVHERIRYEWLMETYREKKSYKFISEILTKDLLISDIDSKVLKGIIPHKEILTRVGVNIKSVVNSTSCIVDAVPKCFVKKIRNFNDEYNIYKLIKNVKQLIIEVTNGLAISKSVLPPILPITINNAIASEACHEAIKFGDPLNVEECTLLVKALQSTKAPTRCAHGRPSIIPLLDLIDIEKRKFSKRVNIAFSVLFVNNTFLSDLQSSMVHIYIYGNTWELETDISIKYFRIFIGTKNNTIEKILSKC